MDTTTMDVAMRELEELSGALRSGAWTPSGPERTCASAVLRATGSATEAIMGGFHLAGPDVAPPDGSRFAQVLMRCSIVLRPAGAGESEAGQRLRELLGTVLSDAMPVGGADGK